MNALTSVGMRVLLLLTALISASASAQPGDPLAQIESALNSNEFPRGEGWAGFLDLAFLGNTLLTLILATALGAIIAYHPKHIAAADTLEELEVPKVYILYAVIGSIIGILVVGYGLVVGFVLFGIGGLIRFRTLLRSANLTGRVIFVTLIGLTVGLNMPHVAVLATAFAFVLVYMIEARVTYRVDIRALNPDRIAESALAYRNLLEQNDCRVVAERKNPDKHRVTLLVYGPRGVRREELEQRIASGIDAPLKGAVDWQTD